ncbi:MAG: hypothetical protein ACE10M_06355, partial [Alphaproteobacteria bacterium]
MAYRSESILTEPRGSRYPVAVRKGNAVGRGTDTTTAVARLLFSGHFLKYTGMNVVLPHGGGAPPY